MGKRTADSAVVGEGEKAMRERGGGAGWGKRERTTGCQVREYRLLENDRF